jgi:hypothetical protein
MKLRDTFGLSLESGLGREARHPRSWRRVRTDGLSEPGAKTLSTSTFLDLLHRGMQRTFEHAEK